MARERVFSSLAAALMVAPLLFAATPYAPLEQAIAAQREHVSEQPGSAAALNDLANLLVESGEMEEAEESYRRAIEIDSELAEPQFNLALLLTATDHPRAARRLLKEMLEKHPDHAWGHYQLGTIRQARGSRRRALHSYREAFRLDPSLTDPRRNPHVIDNTLATAAMLEAFSTAGSVTTAQHIYVEPNRVSRLLLPPLTAEQAMKGKTMVREPMRAAEEDDEADGQEEKEPGG